MILDAILAHKKFEIAALKKRRSATKLEKMARRRVRTKPVFLANLDRGPGIAVIAEIKRRSPSKGLLRRDFQPARIARQYERAGARALSVLTDERFFGGGTRVFREVRAAVDLPLLRKDFIIDEYQVLESAVMRADALLLIACVLSAPKLRRLSRLARSLGMDCLYEVHTRRDIDKILPLKPALVGINNRDLTTFRIDMRTTERLIKLLPRAACVVSESGIQNPRDLIYLGGLGVDAVLVGESLMRKKDPGAALARLFGR